MTISRASIKTGIAVAAMVLLGAGIAVTQPFETGVTRATVCVGSNGLMRMSPSGADGCRPTEQPVRWVVDGEVTDVHVGEGLVASREGGLVNLSLDPAILECEKCNDGKVFAGFNDGPGLIPMGDPPAHEPVPIAELEVPEGSYAVFAKMLVYNNEVTTDALVRCELTAGADSDEAQVVLENTKEGAAQFWGEASRDVLKLQLVHRFQAAGRVVLRCADGFELLGGQAIDGTAKFQHLKIIALKVSSISNVLLGN
jgi:hypothetical protein